ncbi:hypothetical protein CEF21_01965 [Bacillus sp. FJAT-42376]|nr:hypothetical protein CEF21_01965 [Bacillus sp. FJAT-42376]
MRFSNCPAPHAKSPACFTSSVEGPQEAGQFCVAAGRRALSRTSLLNAPLGQKLQHACDLSKRAPHFQLSSSGR